MTNNIKNPNNLNNKFYPNLRDLGGYKTKDNLIIKNELIYRSNELIFENEAATAQIAALNLKNIYDFRTANERTKSPDITLNNVSNNWLDIFRDDANNVAALGESSILKSKSLIEKVTPTDVIQNFVKTYKGFITLNSALEYYHDFLIALTDKKNLPSLYHCTAGKDRTGWATVLILTILNVSKEQIYHDFLASNSYLVPATTNIVEKYATEGFRKDVVLSIIEVKKEYLDTAYTEAEHVYGGMANYIASGLNINSDIIERIKSNLLG